MDSDTVTREKLTDLERREYAIAPMGVGPEADEHPEVREAFQIASAFGNTKEDIL